MSVKKLFGLGKGLETLIPPSGPRHKQVSESENGEEKITPAEGIYYLELNKIEPNPYQPRRDFDQESISELAASIKRHGVLQPLLVSKFETASSKGVSVQYQLIAGERRLRAAKVAGLKQVPVIIKDYIDKDKEKLEISLIENIQREDLNAMEEAEAYKRFQNEFGLSHSEIAKKVGKNRTTVTNAIRLNNLPDYIKESIVQGKLTSTQARTLLSFKDSKEQREVYDKVISGGLIVREIESISRELKNTAPKKSVENPRFKELEKNLGTFLQTQVKINSAGMRGGKVFIKFSNLEELNRIAKGILD